MENSKDIFFHDLCLYDANPKNLEFCKKKYPHYVVLDDLNNNLHINIIFINSVIQYFNINDLEKLFEKFTSILKKHGMIIISDIPKYPRIIEYCLTFFTNFNLFKIQTKQVLSNNYRKTNFYLHSFNQLNLISKKYFTLIKSKNLDINSNRYSIFLKKLDSINSDT